MKIFLQVIFLLALISLLFISGNDISTQKKENDIVLSTGDEPGPDQRPSEWDFIKRTYPFYKADADAYVNAIQQAKFLAEETRSIRLSKGQAAVQWEFAGPLNIGGRVVDIEFDPVNPQNVYAGLSTGGVFKSTDMGVNWVAVFDEQAILTIGDIAIDPINPNIVYVGTGEPNGGHNNFPGGGVYKSTDAGATWNFLGLENTVSIGRVIVHPVNTNIIYLAAVGSYFSPNPERGVYKSTDGGSTWEQSLFITDSTGAIDIVIDPNNPDRLMASMWERVRRPNSSHLYGPSSGLYRTTDSGDIWTQVSSGLPNPSSTNVGRIGLSISQSNPDIVYALYNDGVTITSLYKSSNFGNNWVDVDPDNELADGAATFSWYFGQVRVHPTNPNIVYVMDVAFMRSTNSGSTWPIIYGYSGLDQLHVDHHAMAFHPTNPNYILNGNDGGINISSDGGVNWSNAVHIPATQFYEIGLDANNPQKLYGGTQDNGTNRTQDGGLSNWQNIFGGDGFYVLVDHTNPNIIYAESQNGNLGKSTNGGVSFNDATNGINFNEPTNWSTPVVMDPVTPTKLYYGTNFLYRTTNGASSWTKVSPALTDWETGSRLGTITTIAVAPTNTNVIYVGTDDAHLWVTTNNGTNWTEISNGLPERWVTRVVVDPNDENIVYVTYSGLKWRDPQPHVYRSTNKGNNWNDISSNLPDAPVNAFAVDNNYSNVLYLGSDVGMYVSFDTGASWQVLGEGLPVLPIGDIKIHPTENYLAAGTYGRSMYKINLNEVTSVENINPGLANSFSLEQNYPNPFNPSTIIKFSIPTVETRHASSQRMVTLQVYDALGKKVATLVNEEKPAGTYEVVFIGEALASGVYYYKLTAGNFSETKKMLMVK